MEFYVWNLLVFPNQRKVILVPPPPNTILFGAFEASAGVINLYWMDAWQQPNMVY